VLWTFKACEPPVNFLLALRVWAPGDTTLSRTIGGGPIFWYCWGLVSFFFVFFNYDYFLDAEPNVFLIDGTDGVLLFPRQVFLFFFLLSISAELGQKEREIHLPPALYYLIHWLTQWLVNATDPINRNRRLSKENDLVTSVLPPSGGKWHFCTLFAGFRDTFWNINEAVGRCSH